MAKTFRDMDVVIFLCDCHKYEIGVICGSNHVFYNGKLHGRKSNQDRRYYVAVDLKKGLVDVAEQNIEIVGRY